MLWPEIISRSCWIWLYILKNSDAEFYNFCSLLWIFMEEVVNNKMWPICFHEIDPTQVTSERICSLGGVRPHLCLSTSSVTNGNLKQESWWLVDLDTIRQTSNLTTGQTYILKASVEGVQSLQTILIFRRKIVWEHENYQFCNMHLMHFYEFLCILNFYAFYVLLLQIFLSRFTHFFRRFLKNWKSRIRRLYRFWNVCLGKDNLGLNRSDFKFE